MDFRGILKTSDLSLTKSRLRLLDVLEEACIPLSEKDIEARMGQSCNRTTIYRNLNVMAGKGIVQRILSDDSVKYKLSVCINAEDKKMSEHIHFQCRSCNRVICLEDLRIKDYVLPEGYSKIENQFLIVGICKECNYVEES